MKRIIILFTAGLIALIQPVRAQQSTAAEAVFNTYAVDIHGINVSIDPRIELFNIIAMQFGHSGMTLSNIPYKKESLEYFADFATHHAPKILLETWQKGWHVDDPIFFLLYLDKDFTIRKGLPEGIIERGGGLEHLQKLADAFKDYARESGFHIYFNTVQKPFYEQVLSQTAYNFRDFDAVDMLEKYYGKKAGSYNLILNIMSGYGNFGKSVQQDKNFDLYAIVETNEASGALPVYIPSVATVNLILHEFSHGFVNPEVDKFASEMAEFEHLYKPIEMSMKSQAYHYWHTVVNEHIVRANVIRMAKQAWGESLSKTMYYRSEMGKRYIYLDAINAKLEIYERNREKYPSFADFVPELVTVFKDITEDYISDKQKKVEEIRKSEIASIPKPYAFAKDSTTVFVVGTEEPDKDAEKAMHAWVEEYRNMFSADIRIITDKQALNMDLSANDIVVFGTPAGNTFLKKHIGTIPVTINDRQIVTNKVITGENLQLVTSWVNPLNPEKCFVIYTAQKTKDIRRFNFSPVKDHYHYWIAENLITLEKGDYKNYYQIWMPDIF